MATILKTIVATGTSSGLGFERKPRAAYSGLDFDSSKHSLTVFPLELSHLKSVKLFAHQALAALGDDTLDYLLLNAGMTGDATQSGPHGSQWCTAYVVNRLSQHYLVHLLRATLVRSRARIVVVSSGALRRVSDPAALDCDLHSGSGAGWPTVYAETKFAQLLCAHWWRRQLAGACTVVAVSPGLGFQLTMDMPDAKSVPEGAASILRAFTRDDFPDDAEQIFLTSWGEWWSKDVYALSLDKKLQDK
ncbi:hypothetical protein B0H11DRAFT_2173868 [Mycena galericulata]|nr:hypothetical protein B0H11DRAFT_2173868 [Mycena galericulata]